MTPEQIAEGRRLKAAADEALEMGERVSVREGLKAVDAWDRWLDVNSAALFDAAESAEAAERELAEVQGDAERFEWWFNRDVDKRDFMPTYFQGIRERWSLSNWRAAIDAERGK